MPDLNFLTVNPVTAGIEGAQRMEAQRQRGQLVDLQVQDARAKRAQERAATDALNNIYATGGADLTTEQVHRRLAADPNVGGGRRLESLKAAEDSSLRRTQIEAQARERDSRQFKTLLENGMDGAAAEVAKRMGINIPPDFWASQAKRRALIEKLDIEDRQAGISQKRAAAGASQALAESRRQPGRADYRDYDLTGEDGKPAGFERIHADGRRERFAAPEGTQFAPQGTGPGGRPLDREVRLRMLQEAGVPDDEARRIAAGVSMTPQQIAGFRDRAMKRVQTPDPTTGRLQFRTPAEQDAEVERQVQIVTGGAAQTGARNAPAPAAAGGTPMRNGMAAPRTPEERDALPPGTRYLDPNGNIRVRR